MKGGSNRLSQQTGQVAEVTKGCGPSQPEVIFVVMNGIVKVYEGDLIAKKNVIAMSLVIAMPYAHALGLSCPNRLVNSQSERSRVWSELHFCQAADEDEVVQVQDGGGHLHEFH